MNNLSDNDIMLRVKNGELNHMIVLFERYHIRLYRFFFRLIARKEDGEDLVQDVFERILRYRHSFSGNGFFPGWIFQIARNVLADYNHRTKRLPLEQWDKVASSKLITEGSCEYDVIDEHMLLAQALEQLDPKKKQVLLLSRVEGFRYQEIATIMGCTESAIKVRVFRAMEELRKIIESLKIHPS